MADYPETYKYSQEHEWISLDGDTGTIGITDHAQAELGDVVYVELPAAGEKIEAGASFGTIESVKAVSELYAPVSGEIVEVHDALIDSPELVNEDPHAGAWMVKVRLSDAGELDTLLSADGYLSFLDDSAG
jgi:glycine cleavage system H protein